MASPALSASSIQSYMEGNEEKYEAVGVLLDIIREHPAIFLNESRSKRTWRLIFDAVSTKGCAQHFQHDYKVCEQTFNHIKTCARYFLLLIRDNQSFSTKLN